MVGFCGWAVADQCEKTLIASVAAGKYGYMERGSGQRCEGIYVSPVSGFPVELVSLTRGALVFDNTEPVTLQLALAGKTPMSSEVHFRAVGIPTTVYYQMDATMTAGHVLAWPLQEVVQPQKIAASDIGLYAFQTDLSAKLVLIPVTATTPSRPLPEPQPLLVILRVGTVINLKWRFVSELGDLPKYTPAKSDSGRLLISLPPETKLPGALEVRWDEVTTNRPRVRVFSLGG